MPATPVPAATLMVLRQADPSPEVLLLQRHARSDFLPDLYVFPGGRVEDADSELAGRIGGLSREDAAAALPTVDAPLAPAFLAAAIRETWEECGLLLARRRGDGALVGREVAAEAARHRLAVQEGEESFGDLVEELDLELAADLLSPHAHWITPEVVPKRFDTLFFAASAPPAQRASHDGVESTDCVWVRPEDALEQAASGERRMILPTLCNLDTIAGFARVEDALAASRERPVVPVLPRLVKDGDTRKLAIPEEAGYQRLEELVASSAQSA